MATVATDLTSTAWTDLGTTPCFVQLLGNAARVVIDTVSPGSVGADAHILSTNGDGSMNVQLSGMHIYARAEDSRGARVIVSR